MASGQNRVRRRTPSTALVAFLLSVPVFAACSVAQAQQPGIMAPGDTIVSAFSGVTTPFPPFPTGNPLDETFIDLNGAALQIQRPQPPAPPFGQLVPAPTVFTARARDVGQVFAITHDDLPAPDVFVAATSAYGVQIVVPDKDGDGRPDRVQVGQAGAMFMPGQWGPGGTAGSIYRIDGTNGAISLFTTIGADTGPGIGDIVFDHASRQFFVSDLDTGLIYRLDATGLIRDSYDHGLSGRPAAGLPPVADDGKLMDITSAAFHADDPTTWGYTQPERRVGALAVYGGRLYYSVAGGPQVYSVGINLDGTFANDPRWELDVAGLAMANPVTSIAFDGQGHMLLAQRGAQRGSYDYSVFADPEQSAVVRYHREIPDNPATPGQWAPLPDQYAIGFRAGGLNTTGGIALGYDYDQNNQLRSGACNEYLWTTGESLRDNPALAGTLAAGGPAIVHGLQGNGIDLVRPANDPPFSSYFTDYDGTFIDPAYQGHIGDIDIWQPCAGGPASYIPPYFPPPGYTPPPATGFDLRLDKVATPQSCLPGVSVWLCTYTIRVTNTGPSWYWGPITVDDWLPANPPGSTIAFSPQPPWGCWMLVANFYQCAYPPVFLSPGDSVDLTATVALPGNSNACYLANAARIDWPLGTGDANPADDFAFASALVPTAPCLPPPTGQTTNLKIDKQATPYCSDWGAAWQCLFLVTVTNTGPGVYSGNIVVTDTLSVPDPVFNNAPWTCTNPGPAHTCTDPAATLNPGDSVFLWLEVLPTKASQESAGRCTADNTVHISAAAGGTPQNTNPGDDDALASAATPGRNCAPPGLHSDLSIAKRGFSCARAEQGWACLFGFAVKNEGPDGFFGAVTVKDTPLGFTPLPPSPFFAPPVCSPDGSGAYTCNIGPLYIAPGTFAPPIWMAVLVPDNGQVCTISNRAQIVTPAALTDVNTNPLNDTADAQLMIPSAECEPRRVEAVQQNACPIDRRAPDATCCPDGQFWNGRACAPVAGPPACPPGTTAAAVGCVPTACPAGTTGTPPNCTPVACPPGTVGTPPNCRQAPACPPGTTGTFPNCSAASCPPGTVGTPPNCRQVATCPPGTTGTPPNCSAASCPPGTVGTPPNCRQVATCPPGTTGTPPNCVATSCPPGTVGTPPNCRQVATCPPGTTGTPPNCISASCPPGTVGTPPNCRAPATCPPGTTGTPPNCISASCPPGTVGTPPNCRAPATCPPGTTGTPPNCIAATCPRGTTGRPPNCVAACPPGYTGTPPRCIQAACPAGTTGTPPNCVQASCPAGTTGTPPNCKPTTNIPGIVPLPPGVLLQPQTPPNIR